MSFKLFTIFISLSFIFCFPNADAATFVVGTGNNDFPSIKAAIFKAMQGDTIFISPGVYTEANILIDKDLTIKGHSRHTTFLQALHITKAYVGRIFTIKEGVSASITRITLSNGASRDHGGAIFNRGNLVLSYVTIKNCYAEAPGGGIAIINGSCEMRNTQIIDNESKSEGGGIYLNRSNMSIISSTIVNNQSNANNGF